MNEKLIEAERRALHDSRITDLQLWFVWTLLAVFFIAFVCFVRG